MKKESKILKFLVKLTQNNEITWRIRKISDKTVYSTVYNITKNKSIKIYYTCNNLYTDGDNIIFNYIDNNKSTKSKREIKEVYPFSKFSVFDRIRLKWILKKLHKSIDETNPKSFDHEHHGQM